MDLGSDSQHISDFHCITVKVDCQHGYSYDESTPDPFWSLVVENDWVCDRAHYGSTILQVQ